MKGIINGVSTAQIIPRTKLMLKDQFVRNWLMKEFVCGDWQSFKSSWPDLATPNFLQGVRDQCQPIKGGNFSVPAVLLNAVSRARQKQAQEKLALQVCVFCFVFFDKSFLFYQIKMKKKF